MKLSFLALAFLSLTTAHAAPIVLAPGMDIKLGDTQIVCSLPMHVPTAIATYSCRSSYMEVQLVGTHESERESIEFQNNEACKKALPTMRATKSRFSTVQLVAACKYRWLSRYTMTPNGRIEKLMSQEMGDEQDCRAEEARINEGI